MDPYRWDGWTRAAAFAAVVGFGPGFCFDGFIAFVSASHKAKSTEAASVVRGLQVASLTYLAAFDTLGPVATFPRSHREVDQHAVPWTPQPDLDPLGWAPDTDRLRGAYTLLVREDGRDFLAVGSIDIDHNGLPALYTASRTHKPRKRTGPSVW